jgi:hypothetical protein
MIYGEFGTEPSDFWNAKFVMLVLTNNESLVDKIEVQNYNTSGIAAVFLF